MEPTALKIQERKTFLGKKRSGYKYSKFDPEFYFFTIDTRRHREDFIYLVTESGRVGEGSIQELKFEVNFYKTGLALVEHKFEESERD